MNAPRYRLYGFIIAAVIFVADQVIKWWVAGPLGLRFEGDSVPVLPIFAFTRTHNYGVSLGMFTAQTTEMQLALIAVTGLIALAVAIWMMRETAMGDIAALGLVLGGALGNLVDRIFRAPGPFVGHVVDMISVFDDAGQVFPVFNVADSALSIGVVLAVLLEFSGRRRDGTRQVKT